MTPRYSAKIGPQFEFRVFHNALLRLPQNSYSARWVSDPGIPWQGSHDLLMPVWVVLCVFLGRYSYGYSYVWYSKYARWEVMPRFLQWDSDAALF